jgi:hypothetical protein
MTEPGIKLPTGADELLKTLPLAEPDFEAQAKAIEARLTAEPIPSALSDDDLFRVPDLAAEAGEPPLPSQVRATAPKSHFAEMARKSVQKQDDGAALAKELLAATAQSRRPNAEMVERVRAAAKSAATSTPLPSSQPRTERNSGVVTRGEPTPSPNVEAVVAVAAKPANDNRGVIIGVAGVLVAAAACFALFIKTSEAPSPTAAAVVAERAAAATAPHAAAPQAPVAALPKREEGVVSPEELARADAKTAPEGSHASAASKSLGGGAKVPAAASASALAREDVKLDEDPPPPQPKAAEAPPEPALTPAAAEVQHTGNVPLTPSSGAVSTALSSVRGGAQACLAGQTQPVSAVVTFASDGHVLRVSAGGPAGPCIQAALAKARIAPFAKDSFSAPTTVRPP